VKKGVPAGKNAGKKKIETAIAARGNLCFAGSADAGFPCARHACMKTNGA
jgi:hypothetical protein